MTSTTNARTLARDDLGVGEPALLMVPGWCGDRTVFDRLAAGTSAHRRTISVDLPMHGESTDFTWDDVDSDGVLEALVAAVEAAGVERVVPVTLSHAGWFGIALRRRLGADRVPGLVLLDWMVLGTPPPFAGALAGLQSPAWEQVRAGLTDMWLADLDIPELTRYVESMRGYGQDHWQRAGREIAASFAACPVPLQAIAELQPCPTLHLYAQPTDPEVLAAQEAYSRSHPWFSVERLDARSHFPMLEAAPAMVSSIEAFVGRLV